MNRYAPYLPEQLDFDERLVREERWHWHGGAVHLDRLEAEGSPLTLIIVHGGGGYGRMLIPYGMPAWRDGISVVAPDLPGYGRSERPARLDYATWEDCLADLVRHEAERGPVALLGASMGGMLAYEAAARTRLPLALAATCLLDTRQPRVRRAIARHPALGAAGPALMRAGAPLIDDLRLPMRWMAKMGKIANDPGLAAACASDPLGGGNSVSLRFLRTFLGAAPSVEPEDFDVCPLLLAHPADDRWTPLELSLPFFDRLRVDKRLVLLERAGHFPVEQPGVGQLVEAVGELVRPLLPAAGAAAP